LASFVQAIIYLTLGFVSVLEGLISNRDWIDSLFMFGMMMIVVSAVIMGINQSPNSISIAVGLGIVSVYLLVFLRMNIPQERTHLIEYGVVANLVYQALKIRASNLKKIRFPALVAIVITSFFGVLDETIQWYLPNRVFDFRDIMFNVLASIMAVSSVFVITWAMKKQD